MCVFPMTIDWDITKNAMIASAVFAVTHITTTSDASGAERA